MFITFERRDPSFMWEERVRIYGILGVHNNFSSFINSSKFIKKKKKRKEKKKRIPICIHRH